jgi:VanZ family protein
LSELKDLPAVRAMNDRKPAFIRLGTITLLTSYWLLLFVSTHLPSDKIAHPRIWDKLAHFIAYAGLAFLLAWVVSVHRRPSLRTYAWLLLVAACYGAVDELAQILVHGRAAELWDWTADMIGAAVGLVAHRLSLAVVDSLFPARAS